jgi:hypothetical protein
MVGKDGGKAKPLKQAKAKGKDLDEVRQRQHVDMGFDMRPAVGGPVERCGWHISSLPVALCIPTLPSLFERRRTTLCSGGCLLVRGGRREESCRIVEALDHACMGNRLWKIARVPSPQRYAPQPPQRGFD